MSGMHVVQVCVRCHQPKPLDAFAKHPSYPGERIRVCRTCRGTRVSERIAIARATKAEKPAMRAPLKHPELAPSEFWAPPAPAADAAWYARVKGRLHAARGNGKGTAG